jgi:hypothetical protein
LSVESASAVVWHAFAPLQDVSLGDISLNSGHDQPFGAVIVEETTPRKIKGNITFYLQLTVRHVTTKFFDSEDKATEPGWLGPPVYDATHCVQSRLV